MKLGSLFDGSGTAPLAAAMCGMEPVWASEIEPYPRAVTKARFPGMQHLGDITKIDGRQIAWVDIICGGSPCQDLSVAGKQKGLHEGERSHLFFEMVRIIREMREASDGKYPKYVIWENVPGAFSSNDGRDFLAVLQSFAEIADPEVHVPEPPHRGKTDRLDWRPAGSIVGDGCSIAWRTVDAQFWGVPQRRRRIYLVMAYCGVSGGDRGCEAVADTAIGRAGEILFERKGMRGDTEGSGAQGEGTACVAEGGTGADDREGENIPYTLKIRSGCEGGGNGALVQVDKSATLSTHNDQYLFQAVAYESHPMDSVCFHVTAFDITGNTSNSMKSPNPTSCFRERDVARTLDTFVATPDCNQGGMAIVQTTTFAMQGFGDYKYSDVASGLKARDYKGATDIVCGVDCRNMQETPGLYPTLQAKPNGGQSLNFSHAVRIKYIVRRLTPTECARLQGFPDWWTDGVPGSDTAKYKMWGNGMALPNMLHVMRGIRRLENG